MRLPCFPSYLARTKPALQSVLALGFGAVQTSAILKASQQCTVHNALFSSPLQPLQRHGVCQSSVTALVTAEHSNASRSKMKVPLLGCMHPVGTVECELLEV